MVTLDLLLAHSTAFGIICGWFSTMVWESILWECIYPADIPIPKPTSKISVYFEIGMQGKILPWLWWLEVGEKKYPQIEKTEPICLWLVGKNLQSKLDFLLGVFRWQGRHQTEIKLQPKQILYCRKDRGLEIFDWNNTWETKIKTVKTIKSNT